LCACAARGEPSGGLRKCDERLHGAGLSCELSVRDRRLHPWAAFRRYRRPADGGVDRALSFQTEMVGMPSAAPEPGTWLALFAGLAGLTLTRRMLLPTRSPRAAPCARLHRRDRRSK